MPSGVQGFGGVPLPRQINDHGLIASVTISYPLSDDFCAGVPGSRKLPLAGPHPSAQPLRHIERDACSLLPS